MCTPDLRKRDSRSQCATCRQNESCAGRGGNKVTSRSDFYPVSRGSSQHKSFSEIHRLLRPLGPWDLCCASTAAASCSHASKPRLYPSNRFTNHAPPTVGVMLAKLGLVLALGLLCQHALAGDLPCSCCCELCPADRPSLCAAPQSRDLGLKLVFWTCSSACTVADL